MGNELTNKGISIYKDSVIQKKTLDRHNNNIDKRSTKILINNATSSNVEKQFPETGDNEILAMYINILKNLTLPIITTVIIYTELWQYKSKNKCHKKIQ